MSGDTPLFVQAQRCRGYDAVTYFESDKPQLGSEAIFYSFMGATWGFVSTENRKKFAQSHEMYLPQFGGYGAKAEKNWPGLRTSE